MGRVELIWRLSGVVLVGFGAYNLLRPAPGARQAAAWNRWLGHRAPWMYLKPTRRSLEEDESYQAITKEKTWMTLGRWIAAFQVVLGLGFASGWFLPNQ